MDAQILFEIPDPWESHGYVIEMIINRNWGKTFDYVSFLDFQVLMVGRVCVPNVGMSMKMKDISFARLASYKFTVLYKQR